MANRRPRSRWVVVATVVAVSVAATLLACPLWFYLRYLAPQRPEPIAVAERLSGSVTCLALPNGLREAHALRQYHFIHRNIGLWGEFPASELEAYLDRLETQHTLYMRPGEPVQRPAYMADPAFRLLPADKRIVADREILAVAKVVGMENGSVDVGWLIVARTPDPATLRLLVGIVCD